MNKINTSTYLHFSKILIMKHNFTHCEPSIDSCAMIVYPNVSSTLWQSHMSVALACPIYKFWISNHLTAYIFKLISNKRWFCSETSWFLFLLEFRYFFNNLYTFWPNSILFQGLENWFHNSILFQCRVGTLCQWPWKQGSHIFLKYISILFNTKGKNFNLITFFIFPKVYSCNTMKKHLQVCHQW